MNYFIEAFSWINLRYLLEGLWITIEISVISIIISFILGSIMGIIRYAKIKYLSGIIGFITDILRNLPLILIIFFSYFALPQLIGIKMSTFTAATFALVIFESAMLAEVIRSGIESVPIGQTEGARANGLTFGQTLYYVVYPQAFKGMIPAILSQFISLVKDTSLATIILLPELTYHGQVIYGQNSNYLIPIYIGLAVLYFVVNFALARFADYLNRKLA